MALCPTAKDNGKERQAVADKETATVAHKDAGRISVELEETEEGAEQGDKQIKELLVPGHISQDSQGHNGNGRDTAGEAVKAIKQIDGIGDPDNPQHRKGDGQPAKMKIAAAEQIAKVRQRDITDEHRGQGSQDLPEQFPARLQTDKIVIKAGGKDDHSAGEKATHRTGDLAEQENREEHCQEDGNAGQAGNFTAVDLARVGDIDFIEGDRQMGDGRNQNQDNKESG